MEKSININKINSLFSQGICPNEMCYIKEPRVIIDLENVDYNINLHDHFAKRFKNYDGIQGFDKVLENMAKVCLEPLEEYKLRKKNNNIDINE